MTIDPHLADRLHLLRDIPEVSIDELRAGGLLLTESQRLSVDRWGEDPAPWAPPGGVSIADWPVPTPDASVPARCYTPPEPAATLVWLHGGGFVTGDLDMNESHVVAAELADRAGIEVVTVDYRLARGGVEYPLPVDDVIAVWHALDPRRPRLLGGASAGAAIALSAALRLRRDQSALPVAMVLAYPFVHFPVPAPDDELSRSLLELPPSLRFPTRVIEDMVRAYTGGIVHVPREALPGAADLRGLPPVHIIEDELDDLRPSAQLLGRQLRDVGVEVSSSIAPGMVHGHLNRLPSLPAVDRTLQELADYLRDALRRR